MSKPDPWPPIRDEERMERLTRAVQQAVAGASRDPADPEGWASVDAIDLANALLAVLATVLEPAPAAATPAGLRRLAEAAGKELHLLMRDVRRLREADRTTPTGPH
jgi:hypothetical protein